METVGMPGFRDNLEADIIADKTLEITQNGETVGYFIPAKRRITKAEMKAFRAAKKAMDEMVAQWGASEEELVAEVEQLRQKSREKKRNAGQGTRN